MTCGGTSNPVQDRLNAVSTTQVIKWFTGWMQCTGFDTIVPVLKAKAATSVYFEAQLVLQTAKVRTTEPEAPVTLGSVQTPSSGSFEYNPGAIDVSSNTDEAMFIRFGVAYNYTSGQEPASADVELEVSYHQCGQIAGAATHQLFATTGTAQFIAVTPWLPALLVEEVKAAASATSVTGNFQWRLVYRTAATSKESPGAWAVVTDNNAPYSSGDINTGDLPVSLTGKMWVQLGVQFLSSSGIAQASLGIVIGTRRS